MVVVANSSAGNFFLYEYLPVAYWCWNPPGWLHSACLWTKGMETNTTEARRHLRWPSWQVALQQVNGSLLRAHRDKMCCVWASSVFWAGPQWGKQLWLFQGHRAVVWFLKDFCGKFWLNCFYVGLNVEIKACICIHFTEQDRGGISIWLQSPLSKM